MNKHEMISGRQFHLLVFIFTIGSSVLYIPALLAAEVKQDAWIASGFGLVVGLLTVLLLISVAKLNPELTFVQITEHLLGKWLGKSVSLIFFLYFFILSAQVLRDVGDFMTTIFMPQTPIQAVTAIFLLIVIMGVRYGLETWTRAVEILFPWVILMMLILFLTLTPMYQFSNLQPVFENGVKGIMRASLPFIAVPFFQIVVFLMLFSSVQIKKQAVRGLFFGVLNGGIVLILFTLVTILVLGADTTSREFFPTFTISQKINIGDFLQRIEAIMAGIWFISIYFKLVVCFYASALSLAKILKLQDYKVLTFPLGMILVVLSIVVYPNMAYTGKIVQISFSYFGTIGLLIPLILLGVSLLRNGVTRG